MEIVCRDRSGAYAEAVREGAPDAIQVADRWHLWHNLGEAVEKVVVANRADRVQPDAPADEDEPASAPQDPPQAPAERPETGLAIRTRERFAAIHELLRNGVSRAVIRRQLHLEPADRAPLRQCIHSGGTASEDPP